MIYELNFLSPFKPCPLLPSKTISSIAEWFLSITRWVMSRPCSECGFLQHQEESLRSFPTLALRLWLLTSAPADLFNYLHCALGRVTSRSSFHSQEGPHLLSPLPPLLPEVGSFSPFPSGLHVPWPLSHCLVLSTVCIVYVIWLKEKKNLHVTYVSASFPSRRGLVCLVHHRLQRRGQNWHIVGA